MEVADIEAVTLSGEKLNTVVEALRKDACLFKRATDISTNECISSSDRNSLGYVRTDIVLNNESLRRSSEAND